MIAQIESVAAQYGAPSAADGAGSLEEVMAQAVKDGKLVAVTFVDPKKVKKHGELEEALAAEELAALKERFV
ncbi:MAG: hypothetical protein KDD82_09535, partial [Planctomycetes bacterium]|nr:hypothetical protein [Planctomycetota bacterium]